MPVYEVTTEHGTYEVEVDEPKAQPAPKGGDPAVRQSEIQGNLPARAIASGIKTVVGGLTGLASAVRHPVDTYEATRANAVAEDEAARKAHEQGDLTGEIAHSVYSVPFVGPGVRSVAEHLQKGEIPEAVGEVGAAIYGPKATKATAIDAIAAARAGGKMAAEYAPAAVAVAKSATKAAVENLPFVGPPVKAAAKAALGELQSRMEKSKAAKTATERAAKAPAARSARAERQAATRQAVQENVAKQTALDRVAAMRAGEPVVEAEPIRPPVATETPVPEEIAPEPVEAAPAPEIAPQSPATPKGTAVEELSRLLQKEMGGETPAQSEPIMPRADNAKQSYMFDDPNFFADRAREPKHLRIVDQVQRGAVPVENLPNLQAATDFVRKELKITDAGKLKEWLARNGRAKSPSVEKAKAVSNFLDAQDAVAKADAFAAMRAKPEFEVLTDAQIKAAVDSSDLVRAHVPSADTWKLTEAELARRGAMKPAEAAPDTALGEFERRWKARPMPPGRAKGFGFGSKTVKPGASK